MSFFDALKILFEQTGDDNYLQRMGNALSEEDKKIEELKKKKRGLSMQLVFVSLEQYTLSEILKQVIYRNNYRQQLESQIDQLLETTLKLGHILERIEWHKILNYDELLNSEQHRENERIRKEMQNLFERMEGRNIAIEFRREQQRKAKLTSMLENAKKAVAMNKKRRQMMIDEALQKRNAVILDLVVGSKNLKELRLKHMLKKSTAREKSVEIETIQQIIEPFKSSLKILPLEVVKPANKSFGKPIENYFGQKSPTGTVFKPAKTSHKIHFNVLNFEKFDFEKIEVKQTVIDGSLEKESVKTLHSIQRNPLKNSEHNATDQSKIEKHVQIISPENSECNFGDQNLSLLISSNQENVNEKDEGATCSKNVHISASKLMDVDLLVALQEQTQRESSIETMEPHTDEDIEQYEQKKKSTHISNSKEQTIEEKTSRNKNMKTSKVEQPGMNEQGSNKPESTFESNSSLRKMLEDVSPENMDGSESLNFTDEDQQSNFDDMFLQESDGSDNIPGGRNIVLLQIYLFLYSLILIYLILSS